MKIVRISVYIGMIVAVLVLFAYAVGTGMSYPELHAHIKYRTESQFEDTRFSPMLRQGHFEYLRATNRGHFNQVTFLTDGRMMIDNLEPHYFTYERADGIIRLANHVSAGNAEFLYVRLPSKLQDNSQLPRAFSDNTSIESGDMLLNLISAGGINTLDLREIMYLENMDLSPAFFEMDIHITAETALWMTNEIFTYISGERNIEIDTSMWDFDNFDEITFHQAFQGNEISYVHGYHVFEDITVMFPTHQTNFEKRDRFSNVLRTGNFTDVFMPRVMHDTVETFHFLDMSLQEIPFTRITNENAGNNKNVLLIAESNGLLLSTFKALGFERFDFLYLVTGYTHNIIWNAINEGNYDIVIFAVSDAVVAFDSAELFEYDRLFLGYPPQ